MGWKSKDTDVRLSAGVGSYGAEAVRKGEPVDYEFIAVVNGGISGAARQEQAGQYPPKGHSYPSDS